MPVKVNPAPFQISWKKQNFITTQAAANGHKETCKYLIDKGAKVAAKDKESQTALMWAAAEGHVETCDLLLTKKGTSFNANIDFSL